MSDDNNDIINPVITYRGIQPHEWEIMRPILEHGFGPEALVPDPDQSRAIGAFTPDGTLIAVLTAQIVVHVHYEPFVSLPGYHPSLKAMSDLMDQLYAWPGMRYYVFVQDTPAALAAAKKNGLERHDGLIVHSKEIS